MVPNWKDLVSTHKTDLTRENHYYVYVLRNVDLVTNLLLAFSFYKKHVGEAWPRVIGLNPRGRVVLSKINYFDEIQIILDPKFRILDAIYILISSPLMYNHSDIRESTMLEFERVPVLDHNAVYYRQRSNALPIKLDLGPSG